MPEFLRPRLNGPRFDGGAIPLEMLNDLSVLGEMIIAVAKWRYLQAHPDRQRSPRRFADGISFKLTGVEEGSAIAVIDMHSRPRDVQGAPQFPGMPGEFDRYFDEARDYIIEAIATAELDESTTAKLPRKYLCYFDRIGGRLRDGESIDFNTPCNTKSARLTKDSRRKLLRTSRITEITEEVIVRGSIPEADQDRMTFELQLPEGRKLRGVIHDRHRDVILQGFNSYTDAGKVLIRGIGKYDQQERLTSLEYMEDVNLLDPLDVDYRLAELQGLKDGWLDGEGVAPKPASLIWLAETFGRLYPEELQLPHIYPTVEGGVQAEWTLSCHEASLRIDFSNRAAEWHVLNVNTNYDDTQTLDLTSENDWTRLVQNIRKLSEFRQ